jgi:hypothetical protein
MFDVEGTWVMIRGFCFESRRGGGGISCGDLLFVDLDSFSGMIPDSSGGAPDSATGAVGGGGSFPGVGERGIDSACGCDILLAVFFSPSLA